MSRVGRACAHALVVAALASIAVGPVSGQGTMPSPQAPASMSELLAEVRAIRAEISQAAAASSRVQLLGIRLQLQEQRIAGAARQLSELQDRVRANDAAKAPLAAQVKTFEAEMKKTGNDDLSHVLTLMKGQLAQLTTTEGQLKSEEAYLSQLLAQEQSRWTEFNARIEELERVLSAPPKSVR